MLPHDPGMEMICCFGVASLTSVCLILRPEGRWFEYALFDDLVVQWWKPVKAVNEYKSPKGSSPGVLGHLVPSVRRFAVRSR
jgi:hypothetical protein